MRVTSAVSGRPSRAAWSGMIGGRKPVLTAVWGSRMGDASQSGNRVSARQWLGLVLGLAGLLLVVSRKFGAGNEATAYTLACAVFALLSITIGTLYQKRFVQAADVRSANAIQLGAALLVTLPFAWFEA